MKLVPTPYTKVLLPPPPHTSIFILPQTMFNYYIKLRLSKCIHGHLFIAVAFRKHISISLHIAYWICSVFLIILLKLQSHFWLYGIFSLRQCSHFNRNQCGQKLLWYGERFYSAGFPQGSVTTLIAGVKSYSFPVAQLVEHGVSNAKIMGSIPRERKSW